MGEGLRSKLASIFSWVFILPTVSSTFWLPMWIALTLIFPTIFNNFPEAPSPMRVTWIPQWFFRILYAAWIPFMIIPGSEWITEWLHLPGLWTNTAACLFLEIIRPVFLFGGLFLFLASLIQLVWFKFKSLGLVTNGFYSIVRHPQYLGIFIWTFGHVLYNLPFHLRPADLLAWVSLVFAYILLAINEEEKLEKEYGSLYMNYKNRVSFIVPFISRRIPDKLKPFGSLNNRRKTLILALSYIMAVAVILVATYGQTCVYWGKNV